MSNQVFSNLEQRKRYPLTGQIVEDVENMTTTINGSLHVPDLLYDTLNDDVVSVDSIGVLYKTTKINLLENTDTLIKSVEFTEDPVLNALNTKALSFNETTKKIELTTIGGGVNPFDQDLNTTDDVEFNKIGVNMPLTDGSANLAVLKLRNVGSPNPSSWGCRTEYYISGIGNDNRPYMTINVSRNYDQNLSFGTYWDGISWKSSDNLSSFKWQRAFDKFNFTVSTGAQVAGSSVFGEKAPCYIKSNTEIGFYIDGTQDGGLYLLSPDNTTTNTDLLTRNPITGKTEILGRTDLFGQDLTTTDDVEFGEVKIGVPNVSPASNTRSQLKITALQGSLLPFPKDNIGSRVELYNNNNQYPLVSLSAFDSNDNALSFGAYGGSDMPWVKSGLSFFKWQRFGSELYLFTNDDLDPSGSEATEKIILKYVNTGLDTNIEFHAPVKLLSVENDNLGTQILVRIGTEIKYRDVGSLPTSGGDVVGGISSVDNTIPRYDGITGKLIKSSGVIVDDLDNLACNSLNTGHGNNELYAMNQDVLSTSSVDFKNIFCDNILQTDSLQETTLNFGVDITTWNVQSQKIKSESLVSIPNPLTIELKYAGDNESALSLIAENHDNNGILFDMNHADGVGTTNDFLSGSVNGNVFINKDGADLKFLFQNGVSKGLLVDKLAMNNVMSLSKTGISLNEPAIFSEAVIMKGLTTDPETQNETILLTLSSLAVNEVYKRIYQSVYGTAISTTTPLIVPLPNIDTWLSPNLVYGMTLAKNCAPIGNTITIDAGIDTFIGSVDYALAYSSGSNSTIEYDFSVRINGFIATGALMSTVLKSADERHNISCHFVFPINALDTIELVVKNPLTTEQIIIHNMTLTINKVFQ